MFLARRPKETASCYPLCLVGFSDLLGSRVALGPLPTHTVWSRAGGTARPSTRAFLRSIRTESDIASHLLSAMLISSERQYGKQIE